VLDSDGDGVLLYSFERTGWDGSDQQLISLRSHLRATRSGGCD
jgi:hypothetical protein